MARGLVVGDLRVQELVRAGGRRSFTIVWPEGAVHQAADAFLRTHDGSGTQRTYAYLLVDHLRWLEREALAVERVTVRDLQCYMGLLGAKVPGPHGCNRGGWASAPMATVRCRPRRRCVKGFYVHHASLGVNRELGGQLAVTRLPGAADRRRTLLGHLGLDRLAVHPLAPAPVRRRHPKMLPDGARDALAQVVFTARNRMVITWCAMGGSGSVSCAQPPSGRSASARGCGVRGVSLAARARVPPGRQCQPGGGQDQASVGGRGRHGLRRSDQTGQPSDGAHLFRYLTGEYPRPDPGHGMLLVQLAGATAGAPRAPAGARGMVKRAGERAGLGLVRPHAFRHSFTTAVLDASGGNLVIARDAGGWASATIVEEIYAHVDVQDPAFDAALRRVWGEQR